MGASEWIAALSLITTVVASAIGVAHRLFEAIQQLKQEVADGPKWMVERLEKYDAQLQKVVEDSSISIEVAKQHGEEMNQVRTLLAESDKRNEERHNLILTILKRNGHSTK